MAIKVASQYLPADADKITKANTDMRMRALPDIAIERTAFAKISRP